MAQFLLNHLVADVLAFGDKEAGDQVGLLLAFNNADCTAFQNMMKRKRALGGGTGVR